MSQGSLDGLYIKELEHLYSIETQLIKALPRMVNGASFAELQNAFQNHYEETQNHLLRLQQIFALIGENPATVRNEAVAAMIRDGERILGESAFPSLKDAALIASAQKIEHYEIAAYGTVCTWGRLLGHEDHLKLLKKTIDEEEKADELLSEIAESCVNQQAAKQGGVKE